MSPTRFFVLTIFWTFTFAFLIVAVALSQKGDIKRPPPGVKPSVPPPAPTPAVTLAVAPAYVPAKAPGLTSLVGAKIAHTITAACE